MAFAPRPELPWSPVSARARAEAGARFDDALRRAADRRAGCLWISGAAGAGKTSLLRALAREAEEKGALLLSGLVPPAESDELNWAGIFADARPSIPLASVIASLDRVSSERLRDFVPWLPVAEEKPGKRGSLDAVQLRNSLTSALARLLERLAQRLPVLLFLDELERASAAVATQLGTLLHYLGNSSFLLVVATEPGGAATEELRRSLIQRNRLVEFALEPLGREDIEEALRGAVEPDSLAKLAAWLTASTGGNPTFVRESLQALVDGGTLMWESGPDRWILRRDLAQANVPASLEEMLRLRLGALPPAQFALLRGLGALGGEADSRLLAGFLAQDHAPVRASLELLSAGGLVELNLTSTAARAAEAPLECRLRPTWLADLAFAMDDPESRRATRRRAAEYWGSLESLDGPTRLSRRAWSLDRVDDVAAGERWRAHGDAALAAVQSHRYSVARAHLEAAFVLSDADPSMGDEEPARLLDLCEAAGGVYFVTGPLPRGRELLDRASVLIAEHPKIVSKSRQSELHVQRGRLATRQGRYVDARADFARAVELLGKGAAARDRAFLQFHEANAIYRSGDPAAALALLTPALKVLDAPVSRLQHCRARTLEGILAWAQGRPEDALAIYRATSRALAAWGRHPLEEVLATCEALALADLSRFAEQRLALERGLAATREWGVLWSEAVLLGIWAAMEQSLGEDTEAIRLHQADLALRRTLMDPRGSLFPRDGLSACYGRAGDLDEALALIDEVIDDATKLGVENLMPEFHATRARILLSLGRSEEAMAAANRGLEGARRFQKRAAEAALHDVYATILRDLGLVKEAAAAIDEALAITAGGPVARAGFLVTQATILLAGGESPSAPTKQAGGARGKKRGGAAPASSTGRDAGDRLERARSLAEQALEIFESVGAPKRAVRAREQLIRAGVFPPESTVSSLLLPRTEGQPAAHTRVHCFGPLRVITSDGREIAPGDWGSNKARAIFAFLLLQRGQSGGVPKERVLEAIWPEAPGDSVEKTFHSTLAILRRVFPREGAEPWAAVVQGGGCYHLELDGAVELDCEEFDRAHREALQSESRGNGFFAVSHYRRMAELYRGDFMEDSYLSWTDRHREHYRQAYAGALWRLGVLTLGAWRPEEALDAAHRLLAIDSLDERAHRLAMHAHVALGQRRAAIEQYKRCAEAMKSELQAAPDPETLDLARRIKAGHPLPPL
ncbi:MAG: AAA family ATPase [Candidatus Eisenbacteria bacterium]